MKCGRCTITFVLTAVWFSHCKQPYPIDSVVNQPDYKKGEALLGVKNDSAFYYFNRVVNSVKDSLQIATSLNNMAAIQSDAGDYYGSQESLISSLTYLDDKKQRDYYCLSSDYNELGNTSINLKNYAAAVEYFQKAVQFAKDENFKAIETNNLGLAYQKNGDYARAIKVFESALPQSKSDDKKYARLLSNLARTKWLQNKNYAAGPELWKALQIRTRLQDDWGLNASYAHLADFYANSNPDSARLYAEKRVSLVKRLGSPDDELEALEQYIPFAQGSEVKSLFVRYQAVNDSLQNARNNAKNQFALIRFGAEKNRADNLRLQRDNTEKRLQIVWQKVLMTAGVAVIVVGAIFLYNWYRRRNRRLVEENEQAIRESQLKTSQKVHDVVANGLYKLMKEIELCQLSETALLDRVESLYEQSRDISYEKPPPAPDGFSRRINELLTSFSSEKQNVLVAGNDPLLWKPFSESQLADIEAVLLELMVNMNKHSQASSVLVKFAVEKLQSLIYYSDDGIGLPPGWRMGNGWKNTENRIKALGGQLTFDRKKAEGLSLHIILPHPIPHG